MGRQGIVILAITFAAGFVIVPRYGAAGAAILTALSNLAQTCGMAWLAMPILRRRLAPE
jgi:O-antigen/teichoic acid export membrane protein